MLMIMLTAAGAGAFAGFIVIAAIVILVIRANRKISTTPAASNNLPPMPQLYSSPIATTQAGAVQATLPTSGEYATAICVHSFSAADIKGKERVVCPCGYEFETALLRDYAKLRKQVVETQNQLDATWRKLQSIKNAPRVAVPTAQEVRPQVAASAPGARPAVQPRPTTTAPVAAPKPVEPPKPVIKRKKVTLAPQQWLIIGASVLIAIAASIFVQYGVSQDFPPEFYLLVTIPIAAVTGFMAIWGRKFSVMLANFMAAFSSSMQLASFLVIATIFVRGTANEFVWDGAPAWWWATDFLIVSIIAWLLARFKANFGWKVIALVGFVTSVMFFSFGPIRDAYPIEEGAFGLFASVNVAAAVVLALMSKSVRKFKFEVPKDSPDVEYEKDLAKREEVALQRFTLLATGVLAVLSIGYTAYSFLSGGLAIEPISFSIFAAIWLIAGAFQTRWVDGLTADEKLQDQINNVEHIIGFTATALALNAWVHLIDNLWLGVIGTAVLAAVAVLLGVKVKRVSAHPNAIRVAHFSLLASWLVWYLPDNLGDSQIQIALGLMLVLFGFTLLLQQWFKFSSFSNVAATVCHAIGLAALAFGVRVNGSFDPKSLSYAFIALALILAFAVYSPITALIAKRHELQQGKDWNNGLAVVTGIFAILITVPVNAVNSADYLNIILMLGVSSLVVGILGQILKGAFATAKQLLINYSFIFQGVLALVMFTSIKSTADLQFISSVLLLLSVVNYVLAWLGKEKVRSYIAYGLGVLGIALALDPLKASLPTWSNLLLAIAGAILINLIQYLVAKRSEAKQYALLTFASVFVISLISILSNYDAWLNSEQSVIGLVELIAVALLSAALAERKISEQFKQLFRVNGLVYLVLAGLTFGSMGELNTVTLQRMLVAVLFGLITVRQLVQVSKAENQQVTNGWFALSYLGPVAAAILLNIYLVDNFGDTGLASEFYGLPLGLALAVPALFNRSLNKPAKALAGLDLPVLALLLLQAVKGLNTLGSSDTALTRIAIALLATAGFAYWRSVAEKRLAWVVAGYVAGGIGSLVTGYQLQTQVLPDVSGYPELYTVPLALSLLLGAAFLVRRVELAANLKQLVRVDAPILVPLVGSVLYGVVQVANWQAERVAITLALLAAFAYWRSIAEKRTAWVIAGYVSGGLVAIDLANLIQERILTGVFYPELYTLLFSISLVIGSVFLARQVELDKSRLQLFRVDIPVLIPVVVSIGYSISQGIDQVNSLSRLLASLLLFTAYTYWKLGQQKILAWGVLSYLGILGSLVTLVQLALTANLISWDGPELFSIAITLAIILGNLQLRKVVQFKTSLLSTGLPLASALLPSIIQSYGSLDKQFSDLLPQEISRVVLILVIALVALILGMRQGNLGGTIAGGSALVLVVLPISWVRAGDSSDLDITVSLRSLVISAVLFILFGLLRRAERVPDSSYIYLGIPIAVALVPSLFLTIQALGQSELRQVDWWRFGIIVVVSLVLLIVGALRELGGLFFPGLVGIFVGVLPYAFKPLASQGWFLWVILLVIAAIMVWIAVRLEQLRKMGKSSVSWVKALK